MSQYPTSLKLLLQHLKQLPGVGKKTAERYAFQILQWTPEDKASFARVVESLHHTLSLCPACHCYKEDECGFCVNSNRDSHLLCIVSAPKDVYAIEDTNLFNGRYHVLHNVHSVTQPDFESAIDIDGILKRIEKLNIKEIILALEPTLHGDAIALYLKEALPTSINLSRLALGIPVGSTIDYVDQGTLHRALSCRQPV